MYFFLMIPFLVATAFYLYRDLGEQKKECERLQKSNAAMDEIAKKQIEVIDNLSKDLAAMEENDKKQIQSVEKLQMEHKEIIAKISEEMAKLNHAIEMLLDKESYF